MAARPSERCLRWRSRLTIGQPLCNCPKVLNLRWSACCQAQPFMKQIQKDELYENLGQFLKNKGVELKEGPYTKGIHAGCSMLADAINLSQAGLERARTEIEQKMDRVRQVIHEKTAPKAPPIVPTPAAQAANSAAGTSQTAAAHSPKGGSARRKHRGKTQSHRSRKSHK